MAKILSYLKQKRLTNWPSALRCYWATQLLCSKKKKRYKGILVIIDIFDLFLVIMIDSFTTK